MDAVVLVAGLVVLGAGIWFWSHPHQSSASWRALAFLTVPVAVLAAGTFIVFGLGLDAPAFYAASATAMLVLPPLVVRFLHHLRQGLPKWIEPVAWLLAAGALGAFIVEEMDATVLPGIWFSIAAISPYVVAAWAMAKVDSHLRGVSAMRQRYAAVAIAGAAIITLAFSFDYHGIATGLEGPFITWGHLIFAGGFMFGVTPPRGFVRMWQRAALQGIRLELPALVEGMSEQEYIERATEELQVLVLPGTLRVRSGNQGAPARTVNREAQSERWDVPVLEDEYCLQVDFPTTRVFPEEDRELILALADFLSTRLRAFRYIQSQLETIRSTKEMNRVKSEFMRSLGHELSNPLSPIRLQLAILEKRFGDDPGLLVIERNTKRLMRIISNIRDMSSLQDGRVKMQLEQVDLGQIVSEVVDSMRPVAEAAGLEVRTQTQESLCQADRGRMEQVVGNLLSNAIKYTPEGSVDLHVSLEADAVRVTIQDTGRGLTTQQLQEIGTAYRRFHAAEVEDGTGIGVNVCRAIVQAHHGTMDIDSDGPGKGVTVTVRIPLQQP